MYQDCQLHQTKELLEGRGTKKEEGVGGKRKQAKVESMRCMLAFKPLSFAPQPHAVSIQACTHRIMIHRVPLIKKHGRDGTTNSCAVCSSIKKQPQTMGSRCVKTDSIIPCCACWSRSSPFGRMVQTPTCAACTVLVPTGATGR